MMDKDAAMLLIPVLLVAAMGLLSIFVHYKEWKQEKEHARSLFRSIYRGIYAVTISAIFLIYLICKTVFK
jgi:hypothetical protein